MAELGNTGDVNDYKNAKEAWLSSQAKNNRKIEVYVFIGYEVQGNQSNPNETFRIPKFEHRIDSAYLSLVKVYDTVKGGYFTTGDLNCYTDFVVQGFSQGVTLSNGVVLDEYAGDIIRWNGKLWEVADVLDPVQWGYKSPTVFYSTVLRRTNRSGIGIEVGP
jgi:hypothetical protein